MDEVRCLLVGFSSDETLPAIAWALRRSGCYVDIVNLDKFGRGASLTWSLPGSQGLTWKDEATVHLQATAYSFIWVRDEVPPSGLRSSDLPRADCGGRTLVQFADVQEAEYARREISFLFSGLFWNISATQVINPWANGRHAENKLTQLTVAQSCGFEIPLTMVTSESALVESFCRAQTSIIKGFTPYYVNRDGIHFISYTSIVGEAQISAVAEASTRCPAILQHLVEKEYEIRVCVFFNHVFALRIDVDSVASAKVDWRVAQSHNGRVRYSYMSLDESTIGKINSFMRKLSLQFGCFDFIVTKGGKLLFLECNTSGQFLWMEEVCPRLAILEAVVQHICSTAQTPTNIEKLTLFDYFSSLV
jgi:hypothetical protein